MINLISQVSILQQVQIYRTNSEHAEEFYENWYWIFLKLGNEIQADYIVANKNPTSRLATFLE